MTLRTIEKHLIGAEHVWIIGDTPVWSVNPENVTIIPCPNFYKEKHYKDRNIVCKMLVAAGDLRVPKKFLLAHDDNFINAPCEIDNWPYYNCGSVWGGQGDYARTEENTVAKFGSKVNYDVHCPHIMTKEGIGDLKMLDWTVPYGYCIKTAYAYFNAIEGEFCPDYKIRGSYTPEKVEAMITAGRRFFSCVDHAFKPGVSWWLLNRYPERSKYEA